MQSLGHQFRPIDAAVNYRGRTFQFRLLRETLGVGDGTEVAYFSLHGGQFRQRNGGVNFVPVMDFWWATRREASGRDDDPFDPYTGVMAETYRLFTTSRALQDIYFDAYGSKTIDRTFSLPEEESVRLKGLADAAAAEAVREELESLFLGELPDRAAMRRCEEAARRWVVNGAAALKRGGVPALRRWVDGELAPWVARYRKRGGDKFTRAFLNLFAHEAKAQFHRCVANAWVGIVPWLREHAGLDELGERLISFMNALNRPALDEQCGGADRSGIDGTGADAGAHRGTLCGQLLSLHPVSRYVIAQPGLFQVLSKWLAHPAYESITASGPSAIAACPEYRSAVAAILIAAHEYKRNQDEYENRRGKRTVSGDAGAGPGGEQRGGPLDNVARDDAAPDAAVLFGNYAADNEITCPACGGAAVFVTHGEVSDADDGEVAITFRCHRDQEHHEFDVTLGYDALEAWSAGGGPPADEG